MLAYLKNITNNKREGEGKMNNCVTIVLGKEEITLKINEKAKEEEIVECLEEKIL